MKKLFIICSIFLISCSSQKIRTVRIEYSNGDIDTIDIISKDLRLSDNGMLIGPTIDDGKIYATYVRNFKVLKTIRE